MSESWQNLIDLVVNPHATFTRLKSKPRWVLALIVFCFLGIGLSWATAPFTEQLLRHRLSADELAIESSEFKRQSSFVALLVPALIYSFTIWAIMGGLLTIVARGFRVNKAIKFRHIYAAFLHTSLIRALTFLVNVGMIPLFREVEDIKTAIDFKVIPGLHMLVGSSESFILLAFLSNVHLLSIWQIAIAAVAVYVLAEVNKTTACITGAIIWLFRISMEVTFSIIFVS